MSSKRVKDPRIPMSNMKISLFSLSIEMDVLPPGKLLVNYYESNILTFLFIGIA